MSQGFFRALLLASLADTSAEVAETSSRNGEIERLTRLSGSMGAKEARLVVAYLSASIPQGRIGVGPAVLRGVRSTPAAAEASLTLGSLCTIRELATGH